MNVDSKMKKYYTNKNMLIGILLALLGLSIVDVVLRATAFNDIADSLSNYGESLVTICLSLLLIFFALSGKERVFYILCGAWLAYFVLSQIFGLPGMIVAITNYGSTNINAVVSYVISTVAMICIIAIGGLLVEYMNDGTIHNRAFNIMCIITVAIYLLHFLHGLNDVFAFGRDYSILMSLNALSHVALMFMFTHFAYDSAKTQLSKTQL